VANIVVRDPAKVAWLSQTDAVGRRDARDGRAIRERFPQLLDPPSDDICYATQNRQLAVKEIARDSDLVIVVGSGNSSNSVRLVEVALEAGAGAAHRVDDAARSTSAGSTGVATSASPPARACRRRSSTGCCLPRERGYPDAEAVHSAEESLIFALPPELRRDLRAASKA
jgi:4-hydroxy-3-methylbut-2-enyl diphosphate reductase